MKTTITQLAIVLSILLTGFATSNAFSQCTPPPPPGAGASGGGGGGGGSAPDCTPPPDTDPDAPDVDASDLEWEVGIFDPFDPNDITGPEGFDSLRWVARNETMPYLIRFENDPVFATASAVRVEIICPIDEKFDLSQFRLGDYGFNGMLFEVPPNTATFTTQLDLIEEQGIFVDVTAGVNIVAREAFWIFQSIDPSTGLPVTSLDLGFLPVKDTTFVAENDTLGLGIPGDGFANFSIRPSPAAVTRDTVAAQAFIDFDGNEPVLTNIEVHTIDAFAPTSSIAPLPQTSPTETLELIVNFEDDFDGSGVKDFDLYVSVDEAPYLLYAQALTENVISFTGEPGSNYRFYTRARDNVLNLEAKTTADVETTIADEPCPLDCNGVPCGDAFIDACGDCVGGDTGLEVCVEDCNGDLGGTAYLDECGQCVEGNTELLPCELDCAGLAGGASILDACGVCRLPDDPEFNSTCLDCDGEVNGPKVPGTPCEIDGLFGIFNVDCNCSLIDLDAPCRYFLSDYGDTGGSDIYELFFDPADDRAVLIPVLQLPYRASIAFDREENKLYLLRVDNPGLQIANLSGPSPSLGNLFSPIIPGVSGLVGAAWHNGLLYVATEQPQRITQVNLNNNSRSIYSGGKVAGGDIAFGDDGLLKLVSKAPNRAFNVIPNAPNETIAFIPDSVSGLMVNADGNLLLLIQNRSFMRLGDSDGNDLDTQIQLYLNGELFTTRDGDLASGCATEPNGIVAHNFGDESSAKGSKLQAQPNPTTAISTVSFRVFESQHATLEVYDLSGRYIKGLYNAMAEEGISYSFQFDGSHLPNGVYLYRLTTDQEVKIEKMMIAR